MAHLARAALLALLLAPACKDSDAPDLDSGLPGDRTLGSLTPAEADQFCEASFAYEQDRVGAQELARLYCLLESLFDADGDPVACQTAVDACLADPSRAPTSADCITVNSTPACAATVADQEECAVGIVAAEQDVAREASCTNPDPLYEYISQLFANDPPFNAACERIESLCPVQFE